MKVLLFIVVSLVGSIIAQNPGIGITIRQQLIDGLKEVAVDFLLEKTHAISIPDLKFKGISLHNMEISSPGFSPDNVKILLEDGYIHLGVEGFEVSLSGQSSVNVWAIHFNHTFKLYTSKNALSVDITPIWEGEFVTFTVTNATVHFGTVHFDVDGYFDEIESQVISKLGQDIVDVLNNKIKQILTEHLPKALNHHANNAKSQSSPKPENNSFGFNYSFIVHPTVKLGHLYTGLDGTVYSKNITNVTIPFSNNIVMPEIDSNDQNGLQIFLSQYVVQSALFSSQLDGLLQFNVTNETLPQDSPIQMNTGSLNYIFPGLTKKFGNNQPCYLFCWADPSTYPKVSFTEGGAGITFTSICSLYALTTKNEWSLAVTFKTSLQTQEAIRVNTTCNKVFLSFTNLAASSTSIITTNIGSQSSSLLQFELNLVLAGFQAVFNNLLAKDGFSIPQLPYYQFTNLTMAFHKGYFETTFNVDVVKLYKYYKNLNSGNVFLLQTSEELSEMEWSDDLIF